MFYVMNAACLQLGADCCMLLSVYMQCILPCLRMYFLFLLVLLAPPFSHRPGVLFPLLQGVFAAPDGPTPEDVPEGAVDSTGNPVNVLLYKKFWDLQVGRSALGFRVQQAFMCSGWVGGLWSRLG